MKYYTFEYAEKNLDFIYGLKEYKPRSIEELLQDYDAVPKKVILSCKGELSFVVGRYDLVYYNPDKAKLTVTMYFKDKIREWIIKEINEFIPQKLFTTLDRIKLKKEKHLSYDLAHLTKG